MLLKNSSDFEFLKIGIASPDKIRFWSYGEVEKPETINYRTFKPERKGLFCEKIFGPVRDWECSCGKYRRVRYRGIVCERCGVEVTHSKVRRERMGHLELAASVTHIWFLKGIPSYMGLLLDRSVRELEEIIYYDSYVVIEVDSSIEDRIVCGQVLPVLEYTELKEQYGNKFKADIGASAIKKLLSQLEVKKMMVQLRKELNEVAGQKKLKVTKRLRIFEALYKSGNRPEWVVLDVLPIMPPDLRPMVQLEGGRFATSDLNDLYRRVVNRNNRLKRLMDIGAPDMIIRNEKRMLQESVDVLISNGKRGRLVTGSNGRALKSLGNIIEGKQGRFRQNLLGKRVDYSARSVIVVGPHLKLHQCGLPKEMALELFKPFVIRKLVSEGISSNVKSAKKKIDNKDVEVWDILDSVIKGQPVLLNRAPTLHRLGIQSFEPILVEGSAIQIHPLVCTAFNADFDGDQMAVHVPLSVEAQAECKLLMLSTNNVLAPSSGRSIITPTQDMTLGCYFLTVEDIDCEKGKGKLFIDMDEALRAREFGVVTYQSVIEVRINGERIKTTVGRIIINRAIWEVFKTSGLDLEPYINHLLGKKELSELIYGWFIRYGNQNASLLSDALKTVGFKYSTLSGISISVADLTIPDTKPQIIDKALLEIEKLTDLEKKGVINAKERSMRSINVWREVTQLVSNELEKHMGRLNNVYIMANSGARGNMDQVRQLAGMRGLMSDSQGRTVDVPIRSNFKEGLSLTEYFISAYGARKGLVDTALRTADSGYLTRRLVDVAQDVMITEDECGVQEGVDSTALFSGTEVLVPLKNILEGRVANEVVKYPDSNKIIVKKGRLIKRESAELIDKLGITSVKTRSIYHCKSEKGLCKKCYGLDLSSAKEVNLGEAVGIIAAQSIGEPGTQLTMRTFHTGGVDLRKADRVEITASIEGKVSFQNLEISLVDEDATKYWVSMSEGMIVISNKAKTVSFRVPSGSKMLVKPDSVIEKDSLLFEYDPTINYCGADKEGIVHIDESNLNFTVGSKKKETICYAKESGEVFVYDPKSVTTCDITGLASDACVPGQRVTSEVLGEYGFNSGGLILSKTKSSKTDKKKSVYYKVEVVAGQAYPFMAGAHIFVKLKDKVKSQDVLFKETLDGLDSEKTQDIVQGLPRVEELFEARKPKDTALLAEIAGIVDIISKELYTLVTVTSDEGVTKEYKIPKDSRLLVYSGQDVNIGDQLNTGVINPHDVTLTKGIVEVQNYLSREIQRVYVSQGVQINIKHIEVIVRQMTRKVMVTEMGDSTFLLNELVDLRLLDNVNSQLEKEGKEPAKGKRVLLGITRASLATDSFVSASSFQQTASVLTKAAIEGKLDLMSGLKENVILGRLIPAGTGIRHYSKVNIDLKAELVSSTIDSDVIVESVGS